MVELEQKKFHKRSPTAITNIPSLIEGSTAETKNMPFVKPKKTAIDSREIKLPSFSNLPSVEKRKDKYFIVVKKREEK